MEAFLGTQAFTNFAHDRNERFPEDYEVLFFDECVKAKLNRHVVHFNKDPTPFLNVSACGGEHHAGLLARSANAS